MVAITITREERIERLLKKHPNMKRPRAEEIITEADKKVNRPTLLGDPERPRAVIRG